MPPGEKNSWREGRARVELSIADMKTAGVGAWCSLHHSERGWAARVRGDGGGKALFQPKSGSRPVQEWGSESPWAAAHQAAAVNPMTDQERFLGACCAFDRSRAFEQPLADIGGSRLFAVSDGVKTG